MEPRQMESEFPQLHRYDGASSLYASPSSSVARYLADAGLSRRSIDSPVTSWRDPLLAPSYREDVELENHCRRLREIADRIELAHIRMLEEHDRWTKAIAERAPYTRHIPFYPELPLKNGQNNHTVQTRHIPFYPDLPLENGHINHTVRTRHIPFYPELPLENGRINHTVQMAPCSKTSTVIPGGHKRTSQPIVECSIERKRHKQTDQTQAVSRRPEPARPPVRSHRCLICNISCTSENDLISHYDGKKHREALNKWCNRT